MTIVGIAIVAGLLIGAYDVIALSPALSVEAFVCSVLLTTLAPICATVSLGLVVIVALVAILGRRSRATLWMAGIAIALNLLSALTPSIAVGAVLTTAQREHVAIDPARALLPAGMSAASDHTYAYAAGADEKIDVFAPRRSSHPAPILFDVHGGGWTRDARMDATLRAFARHGWVVVRPSYTLATTAQPTWNVAPEQLAAAYAWTARHATELGGDPRRIAVFGDSAGGGLGLNLANDIAAKRIADVPTPRAIVALYPTVNVAAIARISRFQENEAAEKFVGGTTAEYPDRYRESSALSHLTESSPPTLVIQGASDTFVPPSTVASFVGAAGRLGVPMHSVSLPLANHAFDTGASGSLGQQLVIGLTEKFLDERFAQQRS